jgi:hypothetical protein
MLNYLQGLCGQPLDELWAVVCGIWARQEDVRWMRETIDAILRSDEARAVSDLGRMLEASARDAGASDAALARVADYCRLLEAEDLWFLREMKLVLRGGVQVFETFERDTIQRGGAELMRTVRRLPRVIEVFLARVLASARALGG